MGRGDPVSLPLIYTQGKEEGIGNKLSHHLPRGFQAGNMFKVVRFTEDLTVEVVCSNWETVGVCAYPLLKQSQMLSALMTSETVQTGWPAYQVDVLGFYSKFTFVIF